MKIAASVLCLFLLAACQRGQALSFRVVAAEDLTTTKANESRVVFRVGARPALVVDGPKSYHKPIFIELLRNGRRMDVSPPATTDDGGFWMTPGPLPEGRYTATLFLDGAPSGSIEFAVIP